MHASSLLQEHVNGFTWLQLILTLVAGIAFLLGAVLSAQREEPERGRGIVAMAASLFVGSWLLVSTPEAFGFAVPTGVGVPVVMFTAVLLVVALSTQRWRR